MAAALMAVGGCAACSCKDAISEAANRRSRQQRSRQPAQRPHFEYGLSTHVDCRRPAKGITVMNPRDEYPLT
jgi:hypothetical protein